MDNVLIFGFGKMGSRWAEKFGSVDGFKVKSVVDPDASAREDAEDHGIDAFEDISDLENPSTFDIWVITTPTDDHSMYLREAILQDIELVLTEKPTTESLEESQGLSEIATNNRVDIAVDYIERQNIVVNTIMEDMPDNFHPDTVFHWRGKNVDSPLPVIQDDFCHDVSEIELLLNRMNSGITDYELLETEIQTYADSDYPSNSMYDANATAKIRFKNESNEIVATVRGGFDESETRRYFLWWDKSNALAYFGSTVTRSHLTPVAARVKGNENIKDLYNSCRRGSIVDDSSIENTLSASDAEIIHKGSVDTMKTIARNIRDGAVSPCNFRTAVEIESLTDAIYKDSSYERFW